MLSRDSAESARGGFDMRAAAIALGVLTCAVPCALAAPCTDQTQNGLNACADAAWRRADAALNGAYREIVRRLKDDPATTSLLVEAQKAWIAYRDAECGFASSANAGGSMFPMAVSMCLETITKKRAAELGAYLRCAEGDAGCPVPAK